MYEALFVALGDEASTFKCFGLLMHRIGMRFNRVSEKGIQSCLLKLRQLIEYLDPELFNALRQKVRCPVDDGWDEEGEVDSVQERE